MYHYLTLGPRKAGIGGSRGVRETHGAKCHNWVTPIKIEYFLKVSCFSRTWRYIMSDSISERQWQRFDKTSHWKPCRWLNKLLYKLKFICERLEIVIWLLLLTKFSPNLARVCSWGYNLRVKICHFSFYYYFDKLRLIQHRWFVVFAEIPQLVLRSLHIAFPLMYRHVYFSYRFFHLLLIFLLFVILLWFFHLIHWKFQWLFRK